MFKFTNITWCNTMNFLPFQKSNKKQTIKTIHIDIKTTVLTLKYTPLLERVTILICIRILPTKKISESAGNNVECWISCWDSTDTNFWLLSIPVSASLFGINNILPCCTTNYSECIIPCSFLTSLSFIAHCYVSILVHCVYSLQIMFITDFVYTT